MQIDARQPLTATQLVAGAKIANGVARRFRSRKWRKRWKAVLGAARWSSSSKEDNGSMTPENSVTETSQGSCNAGTSESSPSAADVVETEQRDALDIEREAAVARQRAQAAAAAEREAKIERCSLVAVTLMREYSRSRLWRRWLEVYQTERYSRQILHSAAGSLLMPRLAASYAFWRQDWIQAREMQMLAAAALATARMAAAAVRAKAEAEAAARRRKQAQAELFRMQVRDFSPRPPNAVWAGQAIARTETRVGPPPLPTPCVVQRWRPPPRRRRTPPSMAVDVTGMGSTCQSYEQTQPCLAQSAPSMIGDAAVDSTSQPHKKPQLRLVQSTPFSGHHRFYHRQSRRNLPVPGPVHEVTKRFTPPHYRSSPQHRSRSFPSLKVSSDQPEHLMHITLFATQASIPSPVKHSKVTTTFGPAGAWPMPLSHGKEGVRSASCAL